MNKLRKILFIDDDPITCSLNKELLEEMQVADEVLPFTHQWEALQYIVETLGRKDIPEGSAFDLAFVDVKAPDIDGLQFLLDLEAFRIDTEKLRIVVLSGYLEVGTSMKLANFDTRITAYLSQPLHKKAVEEVLQKLTSEKL